MYQGRTRRPLATGKAGLRIEPSGQVVIFGTIARNTLIRSVRYPVATLVGVTATLITHASIISWLPPETGILATSIIELFAGTALFLFLSTFMVLRQDRLNHVGPLFRSGAFVSLCVSAVVAVPIIIGLLLLPTDWLSAPQWQFLRDSWPIACIGIGVVGTATVLPAFLVAWPIHASVGLPLSKSILFVWRNIEDSSYAPGKMSLFVALVGWLLLTIPGAGLLVPLLYAHLTAVLFNELVVVRER
jgi:hypothetical protein